MSERPPLLTLDEALARLVEGAWGARIDESESVATFDALGRVLAVARLADVHRRAA
jgi:molybdopterin molybdotransferase